MSSWHATSSARACGQRPPSPAAGFISAASSIFSASANNPMATDSYPLTARWLFPVDQPPLARGTLTIEGDRISAVEKAGVRTAEIDLGNVAILPGFTNAHTHLDLSDALGKCP